LLNFLATFFDLVCEKIVLSRRVEFRLEKSEEQVEEIYSVCIYKTRQVEIKHKD